MTTSVKPYNVSCRLARLARDAFLIAASDAHTANLDRAGRTEPVIPPTVVETLGAAYDSAISAAEDAYRDAIRRAYLANPF